MEQIKTILAWIVISMGITVFALMAIFVIAAFFVGISATIITSGGMFKLAGHIIIGIVIFFILALSSALWDYCLDYLRK